eukprot:GHVL01025814.1.p1 GENE.GHVL01025814.1~~GHVL01025814.1.p1  ORF type:complete len:125 (+),score=17.76 GHVL01025814.1:364-738(+)
MREKHRLHERVQLLGAVPHTEVRDVLTRGHVFLNSSLTEAFCISIVEAASCGLLVVSTRVGGVPEVLPSKMMRLAEPNAKDLTEALSNAILEVDSVDAYQNHQEVKNMYNWNQVAARTVTHFNI